MIILIPLDEITLGAKLKDRFWMTINIQKVPIEGEDELVYVLV